MQIMQYRVPLEPHEHVDYAVFWQMHHVCHLLEHKRVSTPPPTSKKGDKVQTPEYRYDSVYIHGLSLVAHHWLLR